MFLILVVLLFYPCYRWVRHKLERSVAEQRMRDAR